MNEAEKLMLLADWFDREQASGRFESDSYEVQIDLRDMARRVFALGGNVPEINRKDH